MRPMHGVHAVLVPIEGIDEGEELIIKHSKTLALGYIVDGQLIPLSRESYHTSAIRRLCFFFPFFIFY
jgi:hypothetical protein